MLPAAQIPVELGGGHVGQNRPAGDDKVAVGRFHTYCPPMSNHYPGDR